MSKARDAAAGGIRIVKDWAMPVLVGLTMVLLGGFVSAWNSFATENEVKRIAKEEARTVAEADRAHHVEHKQDVTRIDRNIETISEDMEDAKRQRAGMRRAVNASAQRQHEMASGIDRLLKANNERGLSRSALSPPEMLDADE